ncbi:hypothetical protein GOP47_0026215 [Adiantum capillus-veneris]|nr:hypothetical protein GOP47_0026215 [Adiantum capillus-veneris]
MAMEPFDSMSIEELARSGTFSTSKEQHSLTSTTTPTPNVFSGWEISKAKELEMAMAMDLKVLQANMKRDAIMVEVVEVRLAKDSMAKSL